MRTVSRILTGQMARALCVLVGAAGVRAAGAGAGIRQAGGDAAGAVRLAVHVGRFEIVCDPGQGGLPATVRDARTGDVLLTRMHIYTDFGLYGAGRGYVGTRGTVPRRFEHRMENGVLVVQCEGVLAGKPVGDQPLTEYRFELRMDGRGRLHVRAGIRPGVDKPAERSAFLALNWGIPGLVEFSAHTAKGILRRRYLTDADLKARAWAARDLPMDPKHPELECITKDGRRVRIVDIRSGGDIAMVGPVVHARNVFLCWLDGPGTGVHAGKWSWIECSILFLDGSARTPGKGGGGRGGQGAFPRTQTSGKN